MADLLVRPDLLAAQLRSLEHVARPGSWWTGEERVAIAAVALAAYADPEPLVPWEPASRHAARLDPDGVLAAAANRDQLHGAQYLTTEQMGDIDRGRGSFTRAQMEFVAARLSAERECFD